MGNDDVTKTCELIRGELMRLCSTYDSRFVFYGLLTHASMIGQRLVAARLMSNDDLQALFKAALADAVVPLPTPVGVKYVDSSSGVDIGTAPPRKH
jgi:hypothetical protein